MTDWQSKCQDATRVVRRSRDVSGPRTRAHDRSLVEGSIDEITPETKAVYDTHSNEWAPLTDVMDDRDILEYDTRMANYSAV